MSDGEANWLLSVAGMACRKAGIQGADCEDATQEVALALWGDWERWRGDDNRRGYIHSRAQYRVVDWIREHGRKTRSGQWRRPPHEPYPPGLASKARNLLDRMVDEEFPKAFEELPQRTKEMVRQRLGGAYYADIAATHGVSTSRISQIFSKELPAQLSAAGLGPR